MPLLRRHTGRVYAIVLAIIVGAIALALPLVIVNRAADPPPMTQSDRSAARAGVTVLRTYRVPTGSDLTAPDALQRAARYEWALARLSERARAAGVPAPSREDMERYLKSYADACCGGDMAELVRRARSEGVSRADLERAIAHRITYTDYQVALTGQMPEPSPTAIARELDKGGARYQRQPDARPVKLFGCMDRACAEGVIASLAAGKDDEEVRAQIMERDPRNGLVGVMPVGPGGDKDLWRAIKDLPTGQWTPEPVRATVAPWVVGVPTGPYGPGRPLPPQTQRELAQTALQAAAADRQLQDELEELIAVAP